MAHNNEKSGVIISHFKNFANGDSWRDIVVIYNATTIDNYEINNLLASPEGGIWHIVINHEKAGVETIVSVAHGQLPALRSHSMMVIHS
jgi:pullulanase